MRRADRESTDGGHEASAAKPGSANPPHVAEILALQRTAGNAAVARAVLARDPNTAWVPPIGSGYTIGGGYGLKGISAPGVYVPPPIPDDVAAAVKSYVQTRQIAIGERVKAGSVSMPEVVAQTRAECPAALRIEPYQVAALVGEVMGRETPPETRGKLTVDGARAQIEASISNSFKLPPTSVTLRNKAGSLELSISGIKAETKIAGAKVTATADKDSGSIEASKGGVSVKAEGSFKGDSFGVGTKVGDVSFGAKIEKEKDAWSKWSMSVSIPVVGEAADAVPPADQLHDAVVKANDAVGRVISHVTSGGSPTDDVVKNALADIKPAIDAVDKATSKPKGSSVTVTGTASGSSSGWSAGVSVVITF
jgi:hypothetical protein